MLNGQLRRNSGMGRIMGLGVAVAGLAAPALFLVAEAQEPPPEPAAPSNWKITASATAVGAAIDEDSALAPAADGFLFDADLAISRQDVLDNGLQFTWRIEGRVQRDAASRPAFAGAIGSCTPGAAGCPAIIDGAGARAPVSPTTGLTTFGPRLDDDVIAALEGASLSVAGPWGEGVFGVDSGVAARLDARAPTVLGQVSAFSPSLDPTGLVTARARNDVAGPALKISYMSPRLLGFRLGASYTPEPSARSVDFDPRPNLPGAVQANLKHVSEAAVSWARTDPASGLRIRAAVTGSWAESSDPDSPGAAAAFGNYAAWGGGLELEQGAWTGGIRYLHSNNAWRPGHADYEAVEVGVVRQGERWRIGAEVASVTDDLTRTEGLSWLVGARRKLNEKVDVGVAWASAEADLPQSGLSGFGHINARNGGLIVELSVHK
jgi:hypothetical protein